MRFKKGDKPVKHRMACKCFRCTGISWNKGIKGTGFALNPENIYKAKRLSEEEKKYVQSVCVNCGVTVRDYVYAKRKFCSVECKTKYQSTYYVGEKAFHYKGGISKYQVNKNWVARNRSKVNFYSARRKARKIGAEGSHTYGEWEKLKNTYRHMCLCCKRQEPEIKLSRDHIVPLINGGTDYIWNIQPLCNSCNSIKQTASTDYRGLFDNLEFEIYN